MSIEELERRVRRMERDELPVYSRNSSFIRALGFTDLTPFERKNPDGSTGYDWDAALAAGSADIWSDLDDE